MYIYKRLRYISILNIEANCAHKKSSYIIMKFLHNERFTYVDSLFLSYILDPCSRRWRSKVFLVFSHKGMAVN